MSPSVNPDRYLTLEQIAKRWNLSRTFVAGIFEKEPDVLVFVPPTSRNKRLKRTIRVPEFVVDRVQQRVKVQRIKAS